jgi:hypothetical protein
MSSTSKFEVAAIAPELLKLGHTELYKLSKALKRYINLCKERNAVLQDGQKMVPATLISCISGRLPQTRIAGQSQTAPERTPSQQTRRHPEAPLGAIKVCLTQALGRVLPKIVPL